jgi:hypothetical protein
MKRVHRDCFIASEMVDFLVAQGLVDTRKQGVAFGRKAVAVKLIVNVQSGTLSRSSYFSDSYHYYRFKVSQQTKAAKQ